MIKNSADVNGSSTINSKFGSSDRSLSVDDFAALFGTTKSDIPAECADAIKTHDFRYRIIDGAERDRVIVDILKKVDNNEFSLAGKEGKGRWDKGWQENLDAFVESGFKLDSVIPKYIRPNQPLRLNGNYVMPADPNFELHWFSTFTQWAFKKYFSEFDSIYEFGCGSAINIATLAKMFPKKKIYGLDWAQASVDLVNKFHEVYTWNTSGRTFDFFNPDFSMKFDPNSVILTVGALEQTGRDWKSLLDFFLRSGVKKIVHIEPICEWYDSDNLFDYPAIRFHQTRNYWQGYPHALKDLEKQGRIEILKEKRSNFGSLYLEGYSQLIWRVKA